MKGVDGGAGQLAVVPQTQRALSAAARQQFVGEFEAEGILATPKSQKAYFGKDVGIKIPQCYVIGINLNHPRLQGVLDDADQSVENLTQGQLKVV